MSCPPKMPCKVKVKSALPTASGFPRGHVTPERELQSNFRLTCVNVCGISGLGGRSAKNGRFTGSRRRTCRKQAAKKENPRLRVVGGKRGGERA